MWGHFGSSHIYAQALWLGIQLILSLNKPGIEQNLELPSPHQWASQCRKQNSPFSFPGNPKKFRTVFAKSTSPLLNHSTEELRAAVLQLPIQAGYIDTQLPQEQATFPSNQSLLKAVATLLLSKAIAPLLSRLKAVAWQRTAMVEDS